MSKLLLYAKMIIRLAIITICFCCSGQVKPGSSKQDVPERKVSSIDNSIWTIYQDSNDDYWFGSNGKGVYHYDGKDIINYTSQDGLVNNQIRDIQEDKYGNLFFDTPGGVNKFDGTSFHTLAVTSSPDNEWMSTPDDLWFKLDGNINGVFRYDGQSLIHLTLPEQDLEKGFGIEFHKENPYSPYGLYSTYKDAHDNLWFGTLSAGVFRYDGESFLWIAEKELTKFDDGRVPGVRSIIEDKDGNYWLSNMLSRYKIIINSSGEVTYQKGEGVSKSDLEQQLDLPYFMSAVKDDQNNLWMLTFSEGVWKYDGNHLTQFVILEEERALNLLCLYKDKSGALWAGTQDGGVYRLSGEHFEKFQFQ